jgi:hypothetical protein
MAAWSGLGVNYGHSQNTVAYDLTGQVTTDLNYLKSLGVTKIRLAFRPYDSAYMQLTKDLAIKAKSLGFYVIFGVVPGSTGYTLTTWNLYLASLPAFAQWVQDSGIDEFCFCNEPELNADGVTLLDATIKADLKTAAVTLKSILGSKLATISTDEGNIASWASSGIGTIDKIGFNVYNTDNNFITRVASIQTNFPTTGYVSEWSTAGGYTGSSWTEQAWADNLAYRLAIIRKYSISSAYFFCYRDGSFGVGTDKWAIVPSTGRRTALNRITNTRIGVI